MGTGACSPTSTQTLVFSALCQTSRFSEDEPHAYAKQVRVSWIAGHVENTMAQTLVTRAYHVALGKAKRTGVLQKQRTRHGQRGVE